MFFVVLLATFLTLYRYFTTSTGKPPITSADSRCFLLCWVSVVSSPYAVVPTAAHRTITVTVEAATVLAVQTANATMGAEAMAKSAWSSWLLLWLF